MVRYLIIGVVIAVAFVLYALVDAAMTDAGRARGVSKPMWIILIVLLPVIGAVLWFTLGKGKRGQQATPRRAPDDDPRFASSRLSDPEIDALRELEERLKELDAEVFPGEHPEGGPRTPESPGASAATDRRDGAPDVPPETGAAPGPVDPEVDRSDDRPEPK